MKRRAADRDLFGWQDPVIDKDLTAPPGSPSEGDRYIVGPSATGAWSGHDDDIAEYSESAWEFYTPAEGWRVDIKDENVVYRYSGTSWIFGGGGEGVARDVLTWVINGPVVTGQNQDDLRVAIRPGYVRSVYITLGDRGGEGTTLVDINRGIPGTPHTTQQNNITLTTIYTTQANRPALTGAAGSATDNAYIKAADPDVQSFDEGDVFGIDVDSVAPQAADLSVMIEVEYY